MTSPSAGSAGPPPALPAGPAGLTGATATPRARSPSSRIAVARVEQRIVPPAAVKAAASDAGTDPLPPTGRPTVPTCFMA